MVNVMLVLLMSILALALACFSLGFNLGFHRGFDVGYGKAKSENEKTIDDYERFKRFGRWMI